MYRTRRLLVIALLPWTVLAQDEQDRGAPLPHFEIASVKPVANDANPRPGGPHPPGTYIERNVELRFLIAKAFNAGEDAVNFAKYRIVGGPKRLLSERFQI